MTKSARLRPDAGGLQNTLPSVGHKAILAWWGVLLFFAALWPSQAVAAEYIAIPAEGSAAIANNDYAGARKRAIAMAFQSALRLAAAGLAPGGEYGANRRLIEKYVVGKGAHYVASYKLLSEEIDQEAGRVRVSLQVTLFLDAVRSDMRARGVHVKRPPLPGVMVIVNERNAQFFSNPDFLLLNSLSEDLISRAYRERGYAVANRADIRRAGMGQAALAAYRNDGRSLSALRRTFETDLFLFGLTEITTSRDGQRSLVNASVIIRVLNQRGKEIKTYSGQTKGYFTDPLAGGNELIQKACESVIRQMTVETPRLWRQTGGTFQ